MIAILFHKVLIPHDKLPLNLPTHVLACILNIISVLYYLS